MPTGNAAHHPPSGGLFFSLDGPDGGGKTTQAARLVAWLKAQGREVVSCREPGGTSLGERLREILLDRGSTLLVLRAEMLLFMASRAQLVEEVIRPAVQAGKIVVCDRFLLASVVYQGYAGGLPVEEIWQVGAIATAGVMPDLTLLIDVPPEVARTRIEAPRDRIEDRSGAACTRVREGFLAAVSSYPAPLVVIDGSADPDTVAAQIRENVEHALAARQRP